MPGLQKAFFVAFQLDSSSKPFCKRQFVSKRVVVHHPILLYFHYALFQCSVLGNNIVDSYSSQFFHNKCFFGFLCHRTNGRPSFFGGSAFSCTGPSPLSGGVGGAAPRTLSDTWALRRESAGSASSLGCSA